MNRILIFENRRNHLEVLFDILELCRTPQAKTHILRTVNTSFKLLEMYLLQLQTSNLLELQPQTKKYYTTKEGRKFIEAWINVKIMLYPQEFTYSAKRNGSEPSIIEPLAVASATIDGKHFSMLHWRPK